MSTSITEESELLLDLRRDYPGFRLRATPQWMRTDELLNLLRHMRSVRPNGEDPRITKWAQARGIDWRNA